MTTLENRYLVIKRSKADDFNLEEIERLLSATPDAIINGAVVEADWPIYGPAEKLIKQYADDPDGAHMLYAHDSPEASVAAVSVQVIGMLHDMLLKAWPHDQKSIAMVMGACAWLTSVLDGKAANPRDIGESFVNACTALDQAMLDEIDRCQHYLNESVERAKEAESKALVSELYASWYLRLRDGDSGNVAVCTMGYDPKMLAGPELDEVMEDLDTTRAPADPEPDSDPLFDSFDDDVLF